MATATVTTAFSYDHECMYINRGSSGDQWLYAFENGYGASVVKGPYSYGGARSFFELAVIKWEDALNFELVYDTSITNDVEGNLSDDKVKDLLEKIRKL